MRAACDVPEREERGAARRGLIWTGSCSKGGSGYSGKQGIR